MTAAVQVSGWWKRPELGPEAGMHVQGVMGTSAGALAGEQHTPATLEDCHKIKTHTHSSCDLAVCAPNRVWLDDC
eukprot:scaffold185780_cov15-Tisochrysis_lutea.AAC.4